RRHGKRPPLRRGLVNWCSSASDGKDIAGGRGGHAAHTGLFDNTVAGSEAMVASSKQRTSRLRTGTVRTCRRRQPRRSRPLQPPAAVAAALTAVKAPLVVFVATFAARVPTTYRCQAQGQSCRRCSRGRLPYRC